MVLSLRSRSVSRTAPPSSVPLSEGTDQIGDSPEFGTRRRPSQTSADTSSLRSRTSLSMKRFFSGPRRKGSQSTDAAPLRTATDAPSKQADTSAGTTRAANPLYPGKGASTTKQAAQVKAASPPAADSASTTITATGAGGSAVGTDGLVSSTSTELPAAGPRPSELFAGKGVQWNQIDLTTGRDLSSTNEAASAAHPVDLQKFLKERRQWIPTFKDDNDQDAVNTDSIVLPKKLEQLNFDGANGASASTTSATGGLKSLRDLEDTHKRKAALLPDATDFADSGASAAGTAMSPSVSAASTSKMGVAPVLPPPPAAPARNQSFRKSTFSTDSSSPSPVPRKSGSISRKPVPSNDVESSTTSPISDAATTSRDIPKRRSSMQRQSSSTSAVEPQQENAGDSAITAVPSTIGTTPPVRPPRSASRTPSRQNSQDAINTAVAAPVEPPSTVPTSGPIAATVDDEAADAQTTSSLKT